MANVFPMTTPPWIEQLRDALARPLPGLPIQTGMSPQPRPGADRMIDPFRDCRQAAVLVLFYPCEGEWRLVLTRRTEALETHKGQISLPGGSLDPGEDVVTAARREAWEELGISPQQIEVLGRLSPLYIPPSGFCIHPVVGYTGVCPVFTPNPNEVAEVIEAPVSVLRAPTTRCEEVRVVQGADVRVPYYAVGPHKVWGATAMVICELLALLA